MRNGARKIERRLLGLLALALGAIALSAASDPSMRVVVDRYPNGALERVASYRGNELDGAARGWYENGAPEYERRYRAGREEGRHRGWYETGAPKFLYFYHDGVAEGDQRQWLRTGQALTLFHYRRGHEDGQQQMWNADGTIRSNYVIKDGRRFGLIGSMGCTGKDQAAKDSIP
jgi:antitoxin component YwqK of YwqJK toxin-antitoxin module